MFSGCFPRSSDICALLSPGKVFNFSSLKTHHGIHWCWLERARAEQCASTERRGERAVWSPRPALWNIDPPRSPCMLVLPSRAVGEKSHSAMEGELPLRITPYDTSRVSVASHKCNTQRICTTIWMNCQRLVLSLRRFVFRIACQVYKHSVFIPTFFFFFFTAQALSIL